MPMLPELAAANPAASSLVGLLQAQFGFVLPAGRSEPGRGGEQKPGSPGANGEPKTSLLTFYRSDRILLLIF